MRRAAAAGSEPTPSNAEPVASPAPAAADPSPSLGTWLRALLALGALVVVVHGTYLFETWSLPYVLGPQFDSLVYLTQAKAALAGHHGDPTLMAMSPLYGYWLAWVGAPADPALALGLQALLGVATIALTARLAWRLSGGSLGATVAAGLVHTGYGWLLFLEGKFLAETLGLALALAAWLVLLRAGRAARAGPMVLWLALGGALLALATLARASFLFALPFAALAAACMRTAMPLAAAGPSVGPQGTAGSSSAARGVPSRARRLGQLALQGAAFAVGLGLVLGARGALTHHHTGLFVPVIMVSKTVERTTAGAAWTGNLAEVVGRPPSAWDVVEQARERLDALRSPVEPPEGAVAGVAGEATAKPGGIDLFGWLKGAPSKAWWTLRDSETTFQYGYYGERQEVPILGALPVTFFWLLVLGGLGAIVVVRRGRWRDLGPGLALIVGTFATTTLFHPSSRYRLGLVIALLPLTGMGVQVLGRWLRRPDRWRALAGVAIALLAWSSYEGYTYPLRNPANWHLVLARSEMAGFNPEGAARRACAALGERDNTVDSRAQAAAILKAASQMQGRPFTPTPAAIVGLCEGLARR